ncbi:hypothetical protein LS72_002975 [Helicobacter apodemus]|uniref:MacA n=1 Tax=Helicobacter apodemus TaxID=135569 RepID=A0A099UJQ6_9HELI|nr:DUF6394 family protein [Helicobacter apodemus]AWI33947.1 hypothetical protein CDV25_03580 [Helicobacter apodemus]MDE6958138.1 hypothetical protein [Helicobacter apodemus]TLE16416.1 hypothetical protein LS72_002975 [Helicobacter apodemus]
MDWGKVIFIFFILMSLTSTIGFLYEQNVIMLFIAAGVNMLSTILKVGVRNYMSSEIMAASLVADLHLIPAFIYMQAFNDIAVAVALALGALAANIVSIVFVVVESVKNYNNYS